MHVNGSVAGPGRPLGIDMELVRGQGGQGDDLGRRPAGELVQDAGWIYVKPNPALLQQLVGTPPPGTSRVAG